LGAKAGPANRNGTGVGLINLGWCSSGAALHQTGILSPKQPELQRRLFANSRCKSLKSFRRTPSEANDVARSIGEICGGHFANLRPKPLKNLHRTPFETKRNGFLKK
jgi:hypothetical protein